MEIWGYDKGEVKVTLGCSVSKLNNQLNFKMLFIYFLGAHTYVTVEVRVQLV